MKRITRVYHYSADLYRNGRAVAATDGMAEDDAPVNAGLGTLIRRQIARETGYMPADVIITSLTFLGEKEAGHVRG